MLAPLTTHARVRMQQRGIPAAAVEFLLDFGAEAHDHRNGCRIVRFDKRSRQRAAHELGARRLRSVERWLDTYAVVGPDDAVVTVGHRHHRRAQP
ncbi:MAG: hypothetical protein ABI789_04615 [Usitatibacter sp.]